MPHLLQCGFLANEGRPGGGEPHNSHEIASATPVPVSTTVQLARPCSGGWGFALAAAGDRVYSWGVNSATLLAKAGGNEDGADPSDLDEVAQGVSEAAAGFDHGLLVQGGRVLAFGPGLRPAGTPPGLHLAALPFKVAIAHVAAGEHHSLALTADGDVYAWGSNAEGQLGSGAGSPASSDVPLLVAGPSCQQGDASVRQPITAIACGARHSLAINAAGQCLAWGWSLHGQCGTGRAEPSIAAPTAVTALGPLRCASVAGGMGHTVVCTDQGDVYAWGLNGDGQLGDGTDISSLQPKLVEAAVLAGESVTKVAAGSRHTLVLCGSGKAFAFGWGAFGQLGSGRFASSCSPVAVAVPAGAKVADVAAGWWHSLIATE